MKNFEEVINKGVIRLTAKERDCLILHESDCYNGAFEIGKLTIIATTEHADGMIVECVSISRDGIRKPNTEEIEMVKNLFWNKDEVKDVTRLYIQSDVIHLRRKLVVYVA